jgi:hypothetical protein
MGVILTTKSDVAIIWIAYQNVSDEQRIILNNRAITWKFRKAIIVDANQKNVFVHGK